MSYDAQKKDISILAIFLAGHMRKYHMVRDSITKYQIFRRGKDGLVLKHSSRITSGSCPWYDPWSSCETSGKSCLSYVAVMKSLQCAVIFFLKYFFKQCTTIYIQGALQLISVCLISSPNFSGKIAIRTQVLSWLFVAACALSDSKK